MIELKLKQYCADCPDFEPDVKRSLLSYVGNQYTKANTTIYCKHRDRCNYIVGFLKQQEEEYVCKSSNQC